MSITPQQRTALIGWLIALSCLLSLLTLVTPLPALAPAICGWSAVLACWPQLGRTAKQQTLCLLFCGLAMLGTALLHGTAINIVTLLSRNIPLVTMLGAVSVLSLANPIEQKSTLPRGRKGLLSTMLTCHLLGAVINLSIIFVVGDRLMRSGKLTKAQVQLTMRSFSTAAFWSPFFVATGVAMTYAPGAEWQKTMLPGLLLTLPMFLLTYRDTYKLAGDDFEGYPLTFESLIMPMFLAIFVLIGHWLVPGIGILYIISLLAPIGALTFMKVRPRGKQAVQFVNQRLANTSSQYALFLVAGVFSTGIEALIKTFPQALSFDITAFTPEMFMLLSGVMSLLCLIGIHPVVSIASVSPFLAPLHVEPTQLAFMYLFVWGLANGCSPLSGIGLAMVSRYQAGSAEIIKLHWKYLAAMWVIAGGLNWVWFG